MEVPCADCAATDAEVCTNDTTERFCACAVEGYTLSFSRQNDVQQLTA